MSDGSKIEWLHVAGKKPATLNPTTGCTKVSPGCKNCYAKREWVRLSANPTSVYYGRAFEDVAMHEERLRIPMLAAKPRRYFVDSMSDLFHAKVTDDFRDLFFGMAGMTAWHTYIVLTKRSDELRRYFGESGSAERADREHAIGCAQMTIAHTWFGAGGRVSGYQGPRHFRLPIANVQLGVSVESREYLHRLDDLRAVPAAVRVLSAEPLLEDLRDVYLEGIHQVYAGGETGPKSRPSAPAWFRSLRDQCAVFGTAFHFKQWGDWAPPADVERDNWKPLHDYVDGEYMMRVGKKNAGRKLDGVEHNGLVA